MHYGVNELKLCPNKIRFILSPFSLQEIRYSYISNNGIVEKQNEMHVGNFTLLTESFEKCIVGYVTEAGRSFVFCKNEVLQLDNNKN